MDLSPLQLGVSGGFEPMGPGLWELTAFSGVGLLGVVVVLLMLLVHVAFALGVYRDADSRPDGPDLVPPIIWALATLLGGVFTAVIYWALHHSTLRARSP